MKGEYVGTIIKCKLGRWACESRNGRIIPPFTLHKLLSIQLTAKGPCLEGENSVQSHLLHSLLIKEWVEKAHLFSGIGKKYVVCKG